MAVQRMTVEEYEGGNAGLDDGRQCRVYLKMVG